MKLSGKSLSSRHEKVCSNDRDVLSSLHLGRLESPDFNKLPAAADGVLWQSSFNLVKGVNGFERVLEAGPDGTLLDLVRDEGPKFFCCPNLLDIDFEVLIFFLLIFGDFRVGLGQIQKL